MDSVLRGKLRIAKKVTALSPDDIKDLQGLFYMKATGNDHNAFLTCSQAKQLWAQVGCKPLGHELIGLKKITYESFLQITNDMIDRARHKDDYHIERIFRIMNFHGKEGVEIDDLIAFLGVCDKHYRREDIESLVNRIDPWKGDDAR